jgi:hypothetical protein
MGCRAVFIVCLLLLLSSVLLIVCEQYLYPLLFVICVFHHNFQRLMSRLEQRWRAQRSVISIVNCRIPWTNRDLNVYCALGISLKACPLQSLCWFIQAHCIVCVSVFYCVLWCALPLMHVIHGACPLIDTLKSTVGITWCVSGKWLLCSGSLTTLFNQGMKLGQQTRWI